MIKLKVTTHSNEDFEVEVENYDAQTLNEAFNNNENNTVAIGDLVISRINIKSVSPVVDAE